MAVNLQRGAPGSARHQRGRPRRHESEAFRTVAWFQSLLLAAAAVSRRQLVEALGECGVDESTLSRYERGSCTPTAQRLRHIDRMFPGTQDVFEVGPDRVPLWDAVWGSVSRSPFDGLQPSVLLPAGGIPFVCKMNLPTSREVDWFVRALSVELTRGGAAPSHGTALAAAIFVDRWHRDQGSAGQYPRLVLIRLLLASEQVVCWLSRFGLRRAFSQWFQRYAIDCGHLVELSEIESSADFNISLPGLLGLNRPLTEEETASLADTLISGLENHRPELARFLEVNAGRSVPSVLNSMWATGPQ